MPSVLQGNNEDFLYKKVVQQISEWGTKDNLMFVVGATHASDLDAIRQIVPDNFLLIPGVGFQGGSLDEVSRHGLNKDYGLLVNASRAIIYASEEEDFAIAAAEIAKQYQVEMSGFLK